MSYGDVRDVLVQLPHNPWGGYAGTYVVSDIFPKKHALMAERCPDARSVFEFGALCGHFLVTALEACPKMRLAHWCDNEYSLPGSNELVCKNMSAYVDITGRTTTLVNQWWSSTRDLLNRWPSEKYDIVHVDGSHLLWGCLIDMTLGLAMRPQLLLVDDYGSIDDVTSVVERFADYTGLPFEPLDTVNGCAVFDLRAR